VRLSAPCSKDNAIVTWMDILTIQALVLVEILSLEPWDMLSSHLFGQVSDLLRSAALSAQIAQNKMQPQSRPRDISH
jgi:hypothetical protein